MLLNKKVGALYSSHPLISGSFLVSLYHMYPFAGFSRVHTIHSMCLQVSSDSAGRESLNPTIVLQHVPTEPGYQQLHPAHIFSSAEKVNSHSRGCFVPE
ncbi:hypothetical protein BDW69DRAFT_173387 [Aspergillus filifer]